MSTISRSKGKRLHNRDEINKLNRKALYLGVVAAGVILLLMAISFFMP